MAHTRLDILYGSYVIKIFYFEVLYNLNLVLLLIDRIICGLLHRRSECLNSGHAQDVGLVRVLLLLWLFECFNFVFVFWDLKGFKLLNYIFLFLFHHLLLVWFLIISFHWYFFFCPEFLNYIFLFVIFTLGDDGLHFCNLFFAFLLVDIWNIWLWKLLNSALITIVGRSFRFLVILYHKAILFRFLLPGDPLQVTWFDYLNLVFITLIRNFFKGLYLVTSLGVFIHLI